jgi:putative hydrolase of the HAD superfamily
LPGGVVRAMLPIMIDDTSDNAPASSGADPRLSEADTWVFDLDNTLYPAACNLFHQVDLRMGGYIAELLGVPYEEARVVQKTYFREHGTTLRGLMENHSIDPHHFLDHVHAIDYSPVPENPDLGAALDRLPGRKLIFTNGTVSHAEAVLDRLGIAARFEAIFDIAAADFVPKPRAEPYRMMIDAHAVTPDTSVMVEDMAKNLKVPAELGMRTVWVRTDHAWSHADPAADYVHHETDDLTAWLTDLVEALERDRAPCKPGGLPL